MRSALDPFVIRGVLHNLSFLSALMAHPRYVEGRISTHTIGEEYPDGFHPADLPHENPVVIICVAAAMVRTYRDRAARIDGQLRGHQRRVPDDWVIVMDGEQHPVNIVPHDGAYSVNYGGKTYEVRSDWQFGQHLFNGTINGHEVHVQVARRHQAYTLARGGSESEIRILTPRAAELMRHMPEKAPPDTSRHLLSPMPGLLVSLAVTVGQEIKAGEELAVLEAMKMENTLRAERNGIVAKINFEAGASLEVGDTIMEFE
jgi:propionyl-CoA carboxylase alpha chain